LELRHNLPKAGPTGGDGFALPAPICSLIKPMTFFAILYVPLKWVKGIVKQ
jgi:hypothetical protein